MMSEIMVRRRIYEGILGNYLINYLTEFDVFIDIVLILHMFYARILLLKGCSEKIVKRGRYLRMD